MTYHALSYTTNNIGDDMQSYVLKYRLRDQLEFGEDINRAKIRRVLPSSDKLLFNGMLPAKQIPYGVKNIIYIGVSCVHFGNDYMTSRAVNHFLQCAPIGCRDHATLIKMQSHNIPAIYTGCITLLWGESGVKGENWGVLNVDIPLSGNCQTNKIEHSETLRESKFKYRLKTIQNASEVYTSRIHVAMPAASLGKRVKFYKQGVDAPHRLSVLPLSMLEGHLCTHFIRPYVLSTRYGINQIFNYHRVDLKI